MGTWWAAAAGLVIGIVGSALVVHRWRDRTVVPGPVPQAGTTVRPDTWELLNEEGRHLLESQRTAAERVEGKAAIVIAGSLAAAQFVARESVSSYALPVAEGSYLASIFCGLACVIPRRVDNVGMQQIINGLWWTERGVAAAELINNRKDAWLLNAERHQIRVLWFWAALATLAVGTCASVVHLTMGQSTDERLNGTCTELRAGTFACTADP